MLKKAIFVFIQAVFIFTPAAQANESYSYAQSINQAINKAPLGAVVRELSTYNSDVLLELFKNGRVPNDLSTLNKSFTGSLIDRDQTNIFMYTLMQTADAFAWGGKTFQFVEHAPEFGLVGSGSNRIHDPARIAEAQFLDFELFIEKSIIDGKKSIVLKGSTIVNNWFNDEVRVITYRGHNILLGYVDLVTWDNSPVSVWWILY